MVPKTGMRHKAHGVRQDAFPMRLVPWALRLQLILHHSSGSNTPKILEIETSVKRLTFFWVIDPKQICPKGAKRRV